MQKRRYEKASGARPGWGPVFSSMVGSGKKKVARKVATRGTAASPGGSSGGGQTLRERAGQSARAQASKRARMANAPAPTGRVTGAVLKKAKRVANRRAR